MGKLTLFVRTITLSLAFLLSYTYQSNAHSTLESATLAIDYSKCVRMGIDVDGNSGQLSGTPHDMAPVIISGDIQVEKAISTVTLLPTPGRAEVTYDIEVSNIGGGDLFNVSLVDDLMAMYGSAFIGVTSAPTISSPSMTGTDPVPNAGYTGSGAGAEMLTTPSTLISGESFTVSLSVELDLDLLPTTAENTATVTANDVNGNPCTDDSDDATDLDGDMIPDNETGGNDDPTVIPPVPSINTAKTVNSLVDNGGGMYDITYRYYIKNTGNTQLRDLKYQDELQSDTYCGGLIAMSTTDPVIISSTATTDPTINTSYDGDTDIDMLVASGTLDPGQEIVLEVTYSVDAALIMTNSMSMPCDNPRLNQSTVLSTPTDDMGGPLNDPVTGMPYAADSVMDDSDSGTTADSNNPGAPNDSGGSNDPTPAYLPAEISVVKSIAGFIPAASGVAGQYDVSLHYTVQNTGGAGIANISLVDDLSAQWGAAFITVVTPPVVSDPADNIGAANEPTANLGYTGMGADIDLLNGDGRLGTGGGGKYIEVDVVVRIDNAMVPATGLMNQATASAVDENDLTQTVSDLSDDNTASGNPDDAFGDNPGAAGDDGTGDTNNATPLQIPEITVTKTLAGNPIPVPGMPGVFEVVYDLTIENTGSVRLDDIGLDDDLQSQFGVAYIIGSGSAMITASTADADPMIDPGFNGDTGSSQIFDLMSGTLQPGQTIDVAVTFQIDAAGLNPPNDTNQATTSGQAVDDMGNPVLDPNNPGMPFARSTDDSDSGQDTRGDNPGEPGDMGTPDDPTPLMIASELTLQKAITMMPTPAASGVLGNYDATYAFVLCNTGGQEVVDVSMNDDFLTQYGSAFVTVLSAPMVTGTTGNIGFASPMANASFDGGTLDTDLLVADPATGLLPGACITVELSIEVDVSELPTPTAPNQATTSGTDEEGMTVSDDSDDATDLDMDDENVDGDNDPSTGGDNDTGGTDDPTLFPPVPEISIVKELSSSTVLPNGDVQLVFNLIIENIGNTILNDLQLDDPLDFLPTADPQDQNIVVTVNALTSTTAPDIDMSYDGVGVTALLDGISGQIAQGEQYGVTLSVEVDPATFTAIMPQPVTNQAVGSGQPILPNGVDVPDPTDPVGGPLARVMDDSDSGTDTGTDNPGASGDMGTSDDPTPVTVPALIEVDKEFTFSATQPMTPGHIYADYTFVVRNIGGEILTSVNLEDDFVGQLGSGFITVVTPPSLTMGTSNVGSVDPTPNMSFNGMMLNSELVTGGTLALTDSFVVTVTVELDLDMLPMPALNSAMATGLDDNLMPVTDLSDDTTDLDGDDNPDNPGMDQDTPTAVPPVPSVSLAKSVNMVVEGADSDQQFVTYRHVIKNTGNTQLRDLVLTDDMVTALQGGYVMTTNIAVMSGSPAATADPTAAPGTTAMDGTNSALMMNTGILDPGQEVIVDITVEVDLASIMPSQPLLNQSDVTATPTLPDGNELDDPTTGAPFADVTDASDSGVDADGNNPGAPNDSGGFDDPTPLTLPGRIAIVKTISATAPAASGTYGNYDVTIDYVIENTGSNDLTNIALTDMIAAQWGSAYVGVTTSPMITVAGTDGATTDPTANMGYDGSTDNELLNADGALSPDENITVQVVVEVDASESPAMGLMNQATIQGTDPLGNDIMDMSDDNTGSATPADPDTDNPDGAGDDGMMGTNNPSPLLLPEIALAKSVTSVVPAASNTLGNFDVTYQLVLENTGTTPLESIILTDNVSMQLAPAYVATTADVSLVSSSASTDPTLGTLPMVYTGTDGLMLPGEIIVLEYTVEIDADMVPILGLDNQANTEATPTDGMGGALADPNNPGGTLTNVMDDSDSGADPATDNPGAPGDMGTPDDPTPLPPLPSINVAKDITNVMPASSGTVGNVDVEYTFQIMNTGNTRLDNIGLVDNFEMQFDAGFIGVTTPPVSATEMDANAAFTGTNSDPNLLDMTGSLESGESYSVTVVIEVDPDASGATYNTDQEFENQATVAGSPVDDMGNPLDDVNGDPFGPVTDDSDTGSTADDTNPGEENDSGGSDDPTVLNVPQIGVAKTIANVEPATIQGNYNVTVRYVVENTGNVNLTNISLPDDLVTQYGAAYVGIVTPPTLASNTATNGPSANAGYTGADDLLVPASTDLLQPNGNFVVDVVVEVDASGATDTLWNQVTVSSDGIDEAGNPILDFDGSPVGPVTDDSDSGTNAETDNPLADDDRGTAQDPTSLVLPNISLSKRQVGFVETIVGDYGQVDLTFEYVMRNTGNVPLTNLQMVDDFVAQLGSGFVAVNSVTIIPAAVTMMPTANAGYNGAAPGNVLSGNDGELAPGEEITIQIEVLFDPIAPGILSPLNNQATAIGDAPDGNPVMDLSDDGSDPEDTNDTDPGAGTGADPYDDPTPVEVPRVYVTKELQDVTRAASNVVGNYDLTFSIKMQNTGNVDLMNLQIMDDMVAQFGSSFIEVLSTNLGPATDAATDPTLSPTYLGVASDGDILDGMDGLLNTLQTVEVLVVVEVDPDATGAPSDLVENTATGSGTDMRGTTVTDMSDDGTDPLTENPDADGDDPTDDRSVDDPTPIVIPSINASKAYVSITEAASDIEGNVDVVFELSVENTGNVDLSNISLVDDLSAQLGSAFVAVLDDPMITASTATTDPVVNTDYDGTAVNADFFDAMSGLLLPDEAVTIQITVELNPNAEGAPVPLMNQAVATGTDPSGNPATDDSDSGTVPEDNNIGEPGDTGGQDDPTLLELPSISVAKSVIDFTRLAASGTVGNFDVTYRFEIQNTGNVDLDNIQLTDDLLLDLGLAFVRVVPTAEVGADNPMILASTANTDPTINAAYDGTTLNADIFDGMSGSFSQDQTITVDLVVEVNPNAPLPPDTLFNQAQTAGDFNGTIVTDDSDSGPVAESNNPGAPNDSGGSADPTPLILSDINISKELLSFVESQSRAEGNIDATFQMLIKNKGNDTLRQIQLVDDISSQIGAAFVQVVPGTQPEIVASTATMDPTLAGGYLGGSENIFTGSDGVLAPNEIITLQLQVEIDPDAVDADMDGTPDTLYNQAMTSGVNPIGMTVTDLSDSGTDPESSNPLAEGDTGGMDDPTPIAVPVISAAKQVVMYDIASSGTSGNLDVTFQIVLKNTGNVPLDNISLLDTLSVPENLGPAHIGIAPAGAPVIITSTSVTNPTINPIFDGFPATANIFLGTDGLLEPCDSLRVEFTAEINPELAIDPSMLFNQATVTGDNDGVTVEDPTDSGTDPKGNNPDGDTNDGNGPLGPDDPTPVYPCISNCEVAAKEQINVGVDPQTCEAVITPSMIGIDIEPFCNFYYDITLFDEDGNELPSDTVDATFIGQNITVKITEPECGNMSWGMALIEDKVAPTISCVDVTISCAGIGEIPPPVVGDDCQNTDYVLINEIKENIDCDDDFIGRITRTYIGIDSGGNESEPCTQTIMLERITVGTILPPASFLLPSNNLTCGSGYATDENGMPAISVTGAPTTMVNGVAIPLVPFDNSIFCNGFSEYEDMIISEESCVTKIMRRFTIGEWHCNSTNEVVIFQMIDIVDDSAPTIGTVPDMTVSTATFSCDASVELPSVSVSDECSEPVEVDIAYPGGFIDNQNGGLAILPVGEHIVTYTAYDACLNSSSTTTTVTVVDQSDPIVLCDNFDVVSIGTTGVASATAVALDDGSFDECGDVTLAVARMDDPDFDSGAAFAEAVEFDCADIGSEIMVALLVTDQGGNTNMCMVQVTVQDKVDAFIECPVDITIDCTEPYDLDNLDAFGVPTLTDNCDETEYEETVEVDVNQCGEGTIVRTFTVLDAGARSCVQTITIDNINDPFSESDIDFPDNYTTNNGCSEGDLSPASLAAIDERFGFPVIDDMTVCLQTGSNFTDEEFIGGSGACRTIYRTWKVIDWCTELPDGTFPTFTSVQEIVINNLTAPEITSSVDTLVVESYAADCGPVPVTGLIVTATDDCTPSEDLFYSYDIDLDDDGIDDISGSGADASGDYPLGDHKVTFTVTDGCGNVTFGTRNFTVVNLKTATPYCLDTISVDLTPMDLDEDGTLDAEMAFLTPEMFDGGTYHSCGYDFVLSFSADTDDTLLTVDCAYIGFVDVQLWATDENGNADYCETTLEVQDNNDEDICGNEPLPGINVQGIIYTEQAEEVENVEVGLMSSEPLYDMTNEIGEYAFLDMPLGGDYDVVPAKNDDHRNGVSTLDLVLVQRHILGLGDLDSPYKMIAADVNNNESISSSDVVTLRKMILGIYDEFPDNTSWRFVDAAFDFPDDNDPWLSNMPEEYEIENLNADMNIDFIGIKTGDVNGSAEANLQSVNSEPRSHEIWTMSIDDRRVTTGEVVEVDIKAAQTGVIYGWQYTLSTTDLNLIDVIDGKAGMSLQHIHDDGRGSINISYGFGRGHVLEASDVIYTLRFQAQTSGLLSELLDIDLDGLDAQAYGESLEISDVHIRWEEATPEIEVIKEFSVSQNEPNPWQGMTSIRYYIPESNEVKLVLKDVTGRDIYSKSMYREAGNHMETLDNSLVSTSGVLIYEIHYRDQVISNKMLLLK